MKPTVGRMPSTGIFRAVEPLPCMPITLSVYVDRGLKNMGARQADQVARSVLIVRSSTINMRGCRSEDCGKVAIVGPTPLQETRAGV